MTKHPATYNDKFISIFAHYLNLYKCKNVLDPFAGVGKLAMVKEYGFNGEVYCNEIEQEWTLANIYPVDHWFVGDAEFMDFASNGFFDAIITSPTYGNRMADHHEAKDKSKRITYRHYLGHELNNDNTGRMQWGDSYREKHILVYHRCRSLLKAGGLFILNVSDHIRKGQVINVSEWHLNTLVDLGFILKEDIVVETPRMRYGKNSSLRVNHEHIYIMEKANVY